MHLHNGSIVSKWHCQDSIPGDAGFVYMVSSKGFAL